MRFRPSPTMTLAFDSSLLLNLSTLAIVAIVGLVFRLTLAVSAEYRRRQSIRNIPGPSSSSWLFGNLLQMQIPWEYGQIDLEWLKKYGAVYRIKGGLGRDRLIVADHAAIQAIVYGEDFERTPAREAIVAWLFDDRGLMAHHGQAHRHLRGALNTGFTATAVRSYQSTFETLAETLCTTLDGIVSQTKGGAVVNLSPLLNTVTLSAISQAALGCPVEDLNPALVRNNSELLELSSTLAAGQILVDEILNLGFVPKWLLDLAIKYPVGQALKTMHAQRYLSVEQGREIMAKQLKTADAVGSVDEVDHVYGKILHSEILGNSENKISLEDLVHQTSIILVAGQDTSAIMLGWLFIALSQRPALQDALRGEILSQAKDDAYDHCPLLNAIIKETIRLWPALPLMFHQAKRDTILPLSTSFKGVDGEEIKAIPILKGQMVTVSTYAYEHLESRWGKDADEFNPYRWLDGSVPQGSALGPYANLLGFWAGPHHCLGWRFA
ncbi:Cytochrome P450 [Mycena chlorophos]|uniref:Cytochrome P450 n=1 Tax=Mycena chlorophos TaxID=658473 RepID=A0A8H6VY57_MYCCL|nr:Cytochrome P450 [Mycena chlorophos]